MLARQLRTKQRPLGKENRPSKKTRASKPYDRPVAKERPPPLKLEPVKAVAADAAGAEVGPATPRVEARIPLRLPRPAIPPVQDLSLVDSALKGVPVEYILKRLRPCLATFLIASSAYRPLPLPHPFSTASTSQPPKLSTLPSHVPFHLPPQASTSNKISSSSAPDVCLAIPGQVGMLIPAHRLVYASQCAHYPGMEPLSPSSTSPSEPSTPESPYTPIPPPPETGTILLPIRSLPVPSPETFPLLHTALYHSSPLWLQKALTDPDRDLNRLTNRQLLDTLTKIHGFWSNVCALGVSNLEIWSGMTNAWSQVIECLKARAGVNVH